MVVFEKCFNRSSLFSVLEKKGNMSVAVEAGEGVTLLAYALQGPT